MKQRSKNFRDISGKRFGRLRVVSFSHIAKTSSNSATFYNCVCDCGSVKKIRGVSMSSGRTKSCGCLQSEITANRNRSAQSLIKKNEKLTYRKWIGMKNRCRDDSPKMATSYKNKGIKICSRWLMSFENFFEDMGRCPKGMTLERKNNNRNYEPSNCIWADLETQANNRSASVRVRFGGFSLSYAQWDRKLGLGPGTTRSRLVVCGWTKCKALANFNQLKSKCS